MATSTPYVCKKERWKISGYICGLPFRLEQIEQQQTAARHDRRVRHVKRGPLILADIEEQKVRHLPRNDAIEHVPRGPAENQREAPHGVAVQPARVRLSADGDLFPLLEKYAGELPGLFIVSQVAVEPGAPGGPIEVKIERASGDKCERCWKYTSDVGSDPKYPTVCGACAGAVDEMLNG
jgi:hypothetical protein